MADYDLVQVSELTATETPANADVLPIQQGTTLKKITYANLKSNVVSDEANARQNADNLKLNKPTGGNGTSGQMLLTNGDGTTQWASPDDTLATTGKAADAKATGDAIKAVDANLAAPYSTSATYAIGDYCTKDGVLKRCNTAITTAEAWNSAHWDDAKLGEDVSTLKSAFNKYDDICRIIKITNTATTLGDVAATLNTVNTVGDHVFFDMSALGVMMYLCTIFIDTANNVYKVFDLVSGRYAEGVYDATMLLTMATAQANGLAVQSQIDYLQKEIDELGGKSVIQNFDVLGDMIQAGTSTDIIDAGDTIDFNWIASVLGTTTNGLTVTCSDMDAFINGVGEAEESTYLFVYDGTSWTYNNETITLADFGLSVSGTPATGEVMTIRTTVSAISYTFTGYDDFTPADSSVLHNWCMEQTYAPDTKAYNTYESLFCVQAGKSIPAGKYYLPMRSYSKGKDFNVCFTLTEAIGGAMKVQARSTGYDSGAQPDTTGASISNTYKPKALNFVQFGTTTAVGTNAPVTCLSDADAASGGYTNLNTLNVDANDPVFVPGDFDKSALGNNCWPMCDLHQWLNDDTMGDHFVPSYDNNIAASYNRGNGFLWGLDPRVKALIQYAEIKWTSGYGNHDLESYQPATGTAPASDAPTYYERSGNPGNRTYTALDPQPSVGDDVSGYFIKLTAFTQNQTYVSEDRAFLLSMKEMSFDIQLNEGNATDLYSEYTNNTLTNTAVAARAKYNKAGGTLNSYRWSRSGISGYAHYSWGVTSTGGYDYYFAYRGYFTAPAFIIGKSA